MQASAGHAASRHANGANLLALDDVANGDPFLVAIFSNDLHFNVGGNLRRHRPELHVAHTRSI